MKEGKSAISGQFPQLVPVPSRGGTGTNQSGTGTTHQNRVGTGTGPSGTGTTAPFSLDFYITKPKFIRG